MVALRGSLTGSGTVRCEDAFISSRIVHDALARRFRLVPIEESSHYVAYKLPRYFRLYGGPVFWPQASVHILLSKEASRTTVSWQFRWPEYGLLLVWFVVALLHLTVSSTWGDVFFLLLIAPLFFTALIFLDTRWVAWRVRQALEEIEEASQRVTPYTPRLGSTGAWPWR